MPRTCSVDSCKNKVKFKFPKETKVRKSWLNAIRQPDLQPNPRMGICSTHFKKTDIRLKNESLNYDLQNTCLKNGAIPSIFYWNSESFEKSDCVDDNYLSDVKNSFTQKRFHTDENVHYENMQSSIFDNTIDFHEVLIDTRDQVLTSETGHTDVNEELDDNDDDGDDNNSTKVFWRQKYSMKEFENNPCAVLELTGLEDYFKFKTVFLSLGKEIKLNYESNVGCGRLSLEDQLFLTLWKLRKYSTDMELSLHFGIHPKQVGNIFNTWIKFMSQQWSKLNTWPSKELVEYYMPQKFKAEYPDTRVIIDGTEIHVESSSSPEDQQKLFSYYKNLSTLKVILGNSPGGVFTYHSDFYGGSASDRQLVERSELQNMCEPGDVIMADRGFNVQDYFAPHDITVATPHFTKGKGYLPHKEIKKDRQFAKFRVHVERMIALLKTYKILSSKTRHAHIPLASEIVGVCVMLCNFKECIMQEDTSRLKEV